MNSGSSGIGMLFYDGKRYIMADFDVGVLHSAITRLQAIHKDHVSLTGSGDMAAATHGTVGRFLGRLASHFGHAAQINNRRVIETLARQIESSLGAGNEYAALLRSQAAVFLGSGRPLSGRKVARILEGTVNQAQEAYQASVLEQRRQEKAQAVAGISKFFSSREPDGFSHCVRDLEQKLGFAPGASGLDQMGQELMETAIYAINAGTSTGDGIAAARNTVRQAALGKYVDSHLDPLVDATRRDHCLDGLAIDAGKFREKLQRTALLSGKNDPFDCERFFSALAVASRAFAGELRAAVVAERLAPLLALDESKSGLLAAYRSRAENVVDHVEIHAPSLDMLQKMVADGIEKKCAGGPIPADDQLGRLRDEILDAYLADVLAMDDIPGDGKERELTLKTIIESGLSIKPPLIRYAVDFSHAVTQGLDSGLRLSDPDELRYIFRNFIDVSELFHSETLERAAQQGLELGSEDFVVAQELAFALGINRLGERIGKKNVTGGILMPGFPFVDLAHSLNAGILAQSGASSDEVSMRSFMRMLELSLSAHASDASRLASPGTSEVSLPYVRKLLGHDRVHGLGVMNDYGAAAAVSRAARLIQEGMSAELAACMNGSAPWGTNADSPSLALCEKCRADLNRAHYMVNGRYMRAAAHDDVASHQAFVAAFPDRRTAYQISTLIHQGLAADVLIELSKEKDFAEKIMNNPRFAVGRRENMAYRVDATPVPGEYQVVFEHDYRSGADAIEWHEEYPEPAMDDDPVGYKIGISLTVQTGNAPAVTACVTDLLLYGKK